MLQAVPDPRDGDIFRADIVADHVIRASEPHDQLSDAIADDPPTFGELDQTFQMSIEHRDQAQCSIGVFLEQPIVKSLDVELCRR